MSYLPQVPFTGIAGWRILERTQANQKAAFEKGPELAREIAYFTANIGKITSAADLVADRRLLRVALGAFGLESEIDKKAFIRKILEEGTTDPEALASRLTEPSYKKLSAAFGFGDLGGSNTGDTGFAATITEAYKTRAFEVAIGETNNDLRLALNFKREIAEYSAGETGGSWYTIIGSKSLRQVFEKAYALPSSSFGKLDVDRQRDILRQKTSAMFGGSDLSVFQDPEKVKKLIDRFLARSQIESGGVMTIRASGVLTLLQGSSGSQGLFNLLLARG